MPPLNEAARLLRGDLAGGTSTPTMPSRTHPRPNRSRIGRRPWSPVRDMATGHATPPAATHRPHSQPATPPSSQRCRAPRLALPHGVSGSRIDRRALRNNAPTVRCLSSSSRKRTVSLNRVCACVCAPRTAVRLPNDPTAHALASTTAAPGLTPATIPRSARSSATNRYPNVGSSW